MDWLAQHTEIINAIANFGVFLVWAVYAQLFYFSYSRQRQPMILIKQVQGNGLNSTCMISNMSMESIHIECIMVLIRRGDRTTLFNVVDQKAEPDQETVPDLRAITHQGPMQSSGFSSLGKFADILRRSLTEDGKIDVIHNDGDFDKILSDISSIEIRVIADYGPEIRPIGAFRRFLVQRTESGEVLIYPERFYTDQVNGFRARHFIIPRWLETCMPEQIS